MAEIIKESTSTKVTYVINKDIKDTDGDGNFEIGIVSPAADDRPVTVTQIKSILKNYMTTAKAMEAIKSIDHSVYLTTDDANNTYVTKTSLEAEYSKKSEIKAEYLKSTDAEATYLKSETASTTYATKEELATKADTTAVAEKASLSTVDEKINTAKTSILEIVESKYQPKTTTEEVATEEVATEEENTEEQPVEETESEE